MQGWLRTWVESQFTGMFQWILNLRLYYFNFFITKTIVFGRPAYCNNDKLVIGNDNLHNITSHEYLILEEADNDKDGKISIVDC